MTKRSMTLTLILVRHGEAGTTGSSDANRSLTKKGERRVRQTGRALKSLRIMPDLILTSPLRRARMTAGILAAILDTPAEKLKISKNLTPGSRPLAMDRELGGLKDASVVLLVGHAPHLDKLIMEWMKTPSMAVTLKKAGAARVDLKGDQASLKWFAGPGILRHIKS
ncbi:MAG: phosphohistidine phosphatase SixA [Planctomycetota bacterium]